MDLGLGNLTQLKAWLLAEELRGDTDFDAAIAQVGRGVAAQFDKRCNRTLVRGVNVTAEFSGRRDFVVVPRYPVESIAQVDVRDLGDSDWRTEADVLSLFTAASGLVQFTVLLGATYNSRIRVTYTGGYYVDTSEDGSGVLPDGAVALPEDLRLAWLQQCRFVWQRLPKLGVPINSASPPTALVEMKLLPEVEMTLGDYLRYDL